MSGSVSAWTLYLCGAYLVQLRHSSIFHHAVLIVVVGDFGKEARTWESPGGGHHYQGVFSLAWQPTSSPTRGGHWSSGSSRPSTFPTCADTSHWQPSGSIRFCSNHLQRAMELILPSSFQTTVCRSEVSQSPADVDHLVLTSMTPGESQLETPPCRHREV
ncbi:uncharacterized protein LOC144023615 [Festucalex cinctus]